VNTGSGSGTIRLDIGDNDSIVDGIGNPLGGPGNANGHFITGEVYTIDKTAPTITNMTLANVGGGNTVGRLDANDTATIVFSEDLIPQSMCSGTPNSGSATSGNLLLDANGDSVVVKVTNGVSGANDVLTIDSVSTSRCSSGFNFGSIDLGNGGFVGANTTYSGTGTNGRSEIRWTSSSKTLIIELGTPSVGGSAVTASVTAVYTPDVDITDFGTNPISGNFSKAATQF
jgi:hypothetical protein